MHSKVKQRKVNVFYTIPALLIVFGLVFVSGRALLGALGKMADSREKRIEAERELKEIEDRYNSLQKKVSYLETDKGVEEAVRTKFNVAKEGEKVFVIVDNNSNTQGEQLVPVERGFFSNLWESFLALFGN